MRSQSGQSADRTHDWRTESVALIGAAGGIGQCIHQQLIDRGATVHSLDITNGFDATDPHTVHSWFSGHPEISTVIYAAGVADSAPLLGDYGVHQLTTLFSANVLGPAIVARAAASSLRAHSGRFVILNSAFSRITAPGYGAYSSSKAALWMLAEALRPELYPATVTDCVLGGVKTPIFHRSAERSGRPEAHIVAEKFKRRVARQQPDIAATRIITAAAGRKHRTCTSVDARLVILANKIFPRITQQIATAVVGPYPAAQEGQP